MRMFHHMLQIWKNDPVQNVTPWFGMQLINMKGPKPTAKQPEMQEQQKTKPL